MVAYYPGQHVNVWLIEQKAWTAGIVERSYSNPAYATALQAPLPNRVTVRTGTGVLEVFQWMLRPRWGARP